MQLDNNKSSIVKLPYAITMGRMKYEDECAAYVKLTDRLHNMRTIEGQELLKKSVLRYLSS